MLKVLVVDDAAFMRTALKMILSRNGFSVVGEAENGSIALRKINELEPDIVTMDVSMPIMGGIEALKEIKAKNEKVRVVMISAAGQEETVREAVLNGAEGYILKPFQENLVMNVINKVRLKINKTMEAQAK